MPAEGFVTLWARLDVRGNRLDHAAEESIVSTIATMLSRR